MLTNIYSSFLLLKATEKVQPSCFHWMWAAVTSQTSSLTGFRPTLSNNRAQVYLKFYLLTNTYYFH